MSPIDAGLILSMRRMQQAEADRVRAEEQRQQQLQMQTTAALLRMAENPDVNLDKMLGMFPTQPSAAGLQAAKELQKATKTRAKQSELAPQAAQLGQAFGASLTPQNLREDPSRARLLAPQLEQLRQAGANTQTIGADIALGQAQEVAGQRELERTALRDERFQIRGEKRAFSKNVDELRIQTLASRFADSKLGLTDAPIDDESAIRELFDVGVDRASATHIVAEARFRTEELASRRAQDLRSVHGDAEFNLLLDDEVKFLQERFPAATIDPGKVRLSQKERLVLDPYSDEVGEPIWLQVGSPAEATKVREARFALKESEQLFGLVRDSLADLRLAKERNPSLWAGPGFTEGIQRFLANFGATPPEVAAYMNATFLLVSSTLKATQGARPSDFDLRMFMALMPLVTEVFSPAADSKMRIFGRSLEIQKRAPLDNRRAAEIDRIKNQPKTEADRRAEAAWRALDRKVQDGTATPADYDQFNDVLRQWQQARGNLFILPGMGDPKVPTPQENLTPAQRKLYEGLQ